LELSKMASFPVIPQLMLNHALLKLVPFVLSTEGRKTICAKCCGPNHRSELANPKAHPYFLAVLPYSTLVTANGQRIVPFRATAHRFVFGVSGRQHITALCVDPCCFPQSSCDPSVPPPSIRRGTIRRRRQTTCQATNWFGRFRNDRVAEGAAVGAEGGFQAALGHVNTDEQGLRCHRYLLERGQGRACSRCPVLAMQPGG
jgi:hypothetical protein